MAAQPQTFSGTLNQAILPEYDHEMANTRKSLERVPDDKLGFKPHAKSMSLGELASHLANVTSWVEAIMNADSFDVSAAPPNEEFKSRTEILATFDKNVAAARNLIDGATDAQL